MKIENEKFAFFVEAETDKSHFGPYYTNEDLVNQIECDDSKEVQNVTIDVYSVDEDFLKDKKVAHIALTLFRDAIFNDKQWGYQIIDEFTDFSQSGYVGTLLKSEEFLNRGKHGLSESLSGFLETFYVYPEFRNRGIGSYLLENLNRLYFRFDPHPLRCLVAYLQPQKPKKLEDGQEIWENIDDPGMLEIMKHTFIQQGFKEKDNSNYYVKSYPWIELG